MKLRAFVGDPTGVDGGHEDAVVEHFLELVRVSMFSAALAMLVCGCQGPCMRG